MGLTLTATPATVQAALKAAQPGDLVALESGAYGDLVIKALEKAGVVHLEPAPRATVDLRSFTITKSAGFSARGLRLEDPTAKNYQVGIMSSRDVLIENFEVSGETQKTAAVWARFNSGVSILGLKAHDIRQGVFHEGNSGIVIARGDFRDIWGDAIRGGLNSDGVLIEDNAFTDLHQLGADHLDAIQFWTTRATQPTRNVVIRDNVYRRGNGSPAQFILIGDEEGVGYDGLLIEGNGGVGGLYNGISVSGGRDAIVRDNFVQPMEGAFDARGKAVTNVWVQYRGSTGGHSSDNFGSLFQPYQNVADPVNERFTAVPLATAGDYSALDAWLKRNDAPADARDAEIAALKAQLAAEALDDAALDARAVEAEARAVEAEARAVALEADLKAAKAALEIVSVDRDDDRAALAAIQAAAASALASFPA